MFVNNEFCVADARGEVIGEGPNVTPNVFDSIVEFRVRRIRVPLRSSDGGTLSSQTYTCNFMISRFANSE